MLAVTHDRYFLDNVAGWILELDRGRGIPFQGNYSSWLEQKQARLGGGGEADLGAPAHAAARAGVGADGAARAACQVEGAPGRLRAAAGRRGQGQLDSVEIHIPAGERLGDKVVEATRSREGLRRPAADRGPQLLAAAGRHRRRDRAQRRRQDDAVSHDRRPGAARRRHAGDGRLRADRLRRPGARRPRPRPQRCGRRSPAARTGSSLGKREIASRAYVSSFNFRGVRPAEAGRRPLRRRAQPAAPGQAAAQRRQPAAAGRADQRPGRGHAARARGCAARLRRLRRGDLT